MLAALGVTPGAPIAPANRMPFDEAIALLERGATSAICRFCEIGGDTPILACLMGTADVPASLAASLPVAPNGGEYAIILSSAAVLPSLETHLRELFLLTAAEARLATALGEGQSLKEAAALHGISVNTARNQLGAIFTKLGVNKQSDLVRSLAQLSAVLATLPTAANPAATGDTGHPLHSFAMRATAPPVQFCRLPDGRRLAYRRYGSGNGQPVLCCSDWMAASLLPGGSDADCRRLGLRLIVPERPGQGQSDARSDFNFATVAEDLVALLDQLRIGQLQLVCSLSGTQFGLTAAALLGRRCTRIMMLSGRPMPGAPRVTQSVANPMVRFYTRLATRTWILDALMAVTRLRMSHAYIAAIVTSAATPPGDAAFLAQYPALIDMFYEGMQETLQVSGRGVADELRCHYAAPGVERQSIVAPVTAWHGVEDSYCSAADIAAWLGPDGGDLRIVAGIGNYLLKTSWCELLDWLATAPQLHGETR